MSKKNFQSNIVYVLSNPAIPGLVKIGRTGRDVKQRMNDLYSTGVPLPFDCEYAIEVHDMVLVENALHNAFEPYRINNKREFFKINVEQAVSILKLLNTISGFKDVTLNIEEALNNNVSVSEKESSNRVKKTRAAYNFSKMNLENGTKLIYTLNNEIIGTIVDKENNIVEIEGIEKNLRQHTETLYGRSGLRPITYWTLEDGTKLIDIYEEVYDYE